MFNHRYDNIKVIELHFFVLGFSCHSTMLSGYSEFPNNHFFVIFLAKKFVLSMIIRIFAPSVPTKPLNDAQMRGAFLYISVHSQNTLMERLPHFMKH